jgi:hypothetical protein
MVSGTRFFRTVADKCGQYVNSIEHRGLVSNLSNGAESAIPSANLPLSGVVGKGSEGERGRVAGGAYRRKYAGEVVR